MKKSKNFIFLFLLTAMFSLFCANVFSGVLRAEKMAARFEGAKIGYSPIGGVNAAHYAPRKIDVKPLRETFTSAKINESAADAKTGEKTELNESAISVREGANYAIKESATNAKRRKSLAESALREREILSKANENSALRETAISVIEGINYAANKNITSAKKDINSAINESTISARGCINSAANAISANANANSASAKKDADISDFASKSVYLVDFNTGTELFERNSDKKLTIASMVKIMTLLLSFEAVDRGEISLGGDIQVSDTAAGMGGSQVFLDANSVHKAENLLKAITVCSANDASVAMAEAVAGSEELFVAKMNERAKELGMENTVFTNCTGLPKEGQYSTARDVAKMYAELLKHKDYFRFTGIWTEDYVHPDGRKTEMTNTNKLVRFYKGCDSGKTGFTNESMYCLSASAVGGNMRVVAVVMGAETSVKRFDDAKKLFNYAFASYENKKLVGKDAEIPNTVKVKGGKSGVLHIVPERDIFALNKKGGGTRFSIEYELPDEVRAKIKKGQTVGKIIVKKDGETVDSCGAVAAEEIEKATVLDGIKKIISKW
ncbi:MAG: D-alanyl-D-alanine carboxypeptidase [Clostridiales bacterium]|jgi:D-alanyl-D-alanine carboxypeptidase (penicillin-binding protein 5/6)|nr:D-alanyl-D-alanine carboxypeptidase [Clostridiales bacterium]